MKKPLAFLVLSMAQPLFTMESNLDTKLYNALTEPKQLQALIEAGADVNYVIGSRSILHWAASYGDDFACKILLNAGANPDTVDGYHTADGTGGHVVNPTPLISAICNRLSEVSCLMIEKGANIHTADANDRGPLYYACSNNLLDVCTLLIEKGAKINAQEKINLWTPLMRCAFENSYPLCKLLLKNGASLSARGYLASFVRRDHSPNDTILMVAAEHKADAAITAIVEHLLFPPRAIAKTFMLCLARLGQTSPSAREPFRQGKNLLAPYLLFNIATTNKEALLEYLEERDAHGQRPWARHPIAMLNPECIDFTIQTLIHKALESKKQ